jgi:hypothetical protein
MRVRLWEWEIVDGALHGECGVSGTSRGAIDALSQALIALEGPGTGRVTPVVLVSAVFGSPSYLRGEPAHTARYHNGVITWRSQSGLGRYQLEREA